MKYKILAIILTIIILPLFLNIVIKKDIFFKFPDKISKELLNEIKKDSSDDYFLITKYYIVENNNNYDLSGDIDTLTKRKLIGIINFKKFDKSVNDCLKNKYYLFASIYQRINIIFTDNLIITGIFYFFIIFFYLFTVTNYKKIFFFIKGLIVDKFRIVTIISVIIILIIYEVIIFQYLVSYSNEIFFIFNFILFILIPLILFIDNKKESKKNINLNTVTYSLKENQVKFIINKANPVDFFLSDEPLKDFEDIKGKYCDIILNLIGSRFYSKEYFSIALNGKWGAGKTSILNEVEQRLKKEKKYRIIKINLWELKKPEDSILELENQIRNLIKEYLFIISNEYFEYFKIVAGLYNDKINNILDIFQTKDNFLNQSKNQIQKQIDKVIKISGINKIIIIFDDIDRVLKKSESLFFMKVIRYVAGFNNFISITGVDIDRITELISKNGKDGILSYEYIYKIFNSVIDLSYQTKQSDLILYIRDHFKKTLKIFLEKYSFNEDETKKIKEEINKLIYKKNIRGLFSSYREIKLSINEFYLKLLVLKNHNSNIDITLKINPIVVFLLSCLKNIDIYFYNRFIERIKYLDDNNYYKNIYNYIKEKLFILENDKYVYMDCQSKGIFKIFQLLGVPYPENIKNNKEDDESFKFEINQVFNKIERNIDKYSVLNFYLNPQTEEYNISIDVIIKHLEDIKQSDDKKIIVFNFLNSIINKSLKNKFPEREDLILNYIEKINNIIFQISSESGKIDYNKIIENRWIYKLIFESIIDYLLYMKNNGHKFYFFNDIINTLFKRNIQYYYDKRTNFYKEIVFDKIILKKIINLGSDIIENYNILEENYFLEESLFFDFCLLFNYNNIESSVDLHIKYIKLLGENDLFDIHTICFIIKYINNYYIYLIKSLEMPLNNKNYMEQNKNIIQTKLIDLFNFKIKNLNDIDEVFLNKLLQNLSNRNFGLGLIAGWDYDFIDEILSNINIIDLMYVIYDKLEKISKDKNKDDLITNEYYEDFKIVIERYLEYLTTSKRIRYFHNKIDKMIGIINDFSSLSKIEQYEFKNIFIGENNKDKEIKYEQLVKNKDDIIKILKIIQQLYTLPNILPRKN